MQFQNNQLFESRIPVFAGFFAVLLWFATMPGIAAAAAQAAEQSAETTTIQVADSGVAPMNRTAGAISKNPGQLLAGGTPGAQAANSASVPGSVIALVVALIAVVAVARRDTSGTTHHP